MARMASGERQDGDSITVIFELDAQAHLAMHTVYLQPFAAVCLPSIPYPADTHRMAEGAAGQAQARREPMQAT